MNITLKEIAQKANVSISTVSNIINNREKYYSQETKEKVMAIIETHKYVPNYAARALNGKCIKTIGVIVPSVKKGYFNELIESIEEVCYKENYSMSLCNSNGDANKERDYLNKTIERGIVGVIYISEACKVEKELVKLTSYGVPVVTVGGIGRIANCYNIGVNNFLGTLKATRHLIKQGHREIGYIGGTEYSVCNKERVDGFRQAMQEAGLSVRGRNFYFGKYDIQTGEAGIEELQQYNYTGIVAGNDEIAYGVYRFCVMNQIKIPEELSVIGFDDIALAKKMVPELTTMKQPTTNIGVLAVEQLIKVIENKQIEWEFKLMAPWLVERESTAEI